LFTASNLVQSELPMAEPRRNFERHRTEIGPDYLDLLSLLREVIAR
jgi:hypothetical protein